MPVLTARFEWQHVGMSTKWKLGAFWNEVSSDPSGVGTRNKGSKRDSSRRRETKRYREARTLRARRVTAEIGCYVPSVL